MSTNLRPGESFDRYTVESMLGEGGMASVYSVRHKTLGSGHALKLLKVENEQVKSRLVSEGQVQATLKHPNIVAVTDVIIIRGHLGLLMEQIDGPGLDYWLQNNRPGVEDALKLFRGILAGVARAHRAGLVHRDLKPGNVLLDSADGMVIPKVADFGLAKILSDEQGGHSQTRSGVAMGTPQFMAPEQIRNAKDVDQRADVFALGCILYTLLCHRIPFDDPDLLELYNKIATGRFEQPEIFVPDLPQHVGDAIRACLEVDRNNRAKDCDAVRLMLYGDEINISGGVKLAMVTDFLPPPRAMPLIGTQTKMPDSADTTMGRSMQPMSMQPSSMGSVGNVGAVTYGALAVAGFALLGIAVLSVAGGFWWMNQQKIEAPPAVVAAPAAPSKSPLGAVKAADPSAATPSAPTPSASGAKPVAVKPTPTKPVTAPVEAPVAPPPEAKPKEVPTGRLVVLGSAERFSLSAGGRSYGQGSVPAGTYDAAYQFAGNDVQVLKSVKIVADGTTTVECQDAFKSCRVK